MHLTWHGNYTIKIQTNETVIIIDPYQGEQGSGGWRGKADIIALTNPSDPSMSHVSGVQGEPVTLNTPGEYALAGTTLAAIGWHDTDSREHSMLRWEIEGMLILNPGALNRELSDTELQQLETTTIDILILPIGGGSGLNTQQALKLLTVIEPRIVIPINYKTTNTGTDLNTVEQFAKEMGVSPNQIEKKLVIKASKLPQDELQTVLLTP